MARKPKKSKPIPPHDPDDRELTDQDITEMVVGASAIAGQSIETKPFHHAISPRHFTSPLQPNSAVQSAAQGDQRRGASRVPDVANGPGPTLPTSVDRT